MKIEQSFPRSSNSFFLQDIGLHDLLLSLSSTLEFGVEVRNIIFNIYKYSPDAGFPQFFPRVALECKCCNNLNYILCV